MFERIAKRIVRTGRAHRWLLPLALLVLLVLFGGAALWEQAVRLGIWARKAARRVLLEVRELRQDCTESSPYRPVHRVLASVLAVCLMLTMLPTTALASETGVPPSGSICGHVHDENCGYIAAVKGSPCSHQNEDGTYSCAPVLDSGSHTDYVCDHSDGCGYVEAVEGADCTHSCELCKTPSYQEVVALFEALPSAGSITEETTQEQLDELTAQINAALDALDALSDEGFAKFTEKHSDLLAAVAALQAAILGAVPVTLADTVPTVKNKNIYANGLDLKLERGNVEAYTQIYYRAMGSSSPYTLFKISSLTPDVSDAYDLASYTVYGGGGGNSTVSSTKITMNGGKVKAIYGGGGGSGTFDSTVTGEAAVKITGGAVTESVCGGGFGSNNTVGSTSIIMEGGTVGSIYGGSGSSTSAVTGDASITVTGGTAATVYSGGANSSAVGGSSSVTIGGTAKIGDPDFGFGIVVNGGTITTGMDSFKIDPDLSGADGSICVVLLDGYTVGTIATDAVETDLAKIVITGSGAAGKEAYFDSADHTIKVRVAAVPAVELWRSGAKQSEYATLETAIEAAKTGDTLKIVAPIDLGTTGVTISGKSLILDLNGKTITYGGVINGHTITLENGAGLTIKDSGTGGKLAVTDTAFAIYNNSTGTVTVEGGTVSTIGGYAIFNYSSGNVVVTGGTVTASGMGSYAILSNSGTVTVTGGTVSATGKNGIAIQNVSTGKITISGNAEVTSKNEYTTQGTIYIVQVPQSAPKTMLEITGGTVSNTASPEGYSVYFASNSVTPANVGDYYSKTGGTMGKVYPEPLADPTPTVEKVSDYVNYLYANGLDLKLEAGDTADKTKVSYRTLGSDDPYTPYAIPETTGDTTTGYDLSYWTIHGGSKDGDVAGASITMTGGKVQFLIGGGRAVTANANVTGNTSVIVQGGTLTANVYGGGNASGEGLTANVGGNTSVTVEGIASVYTVYGGGGSAAGTVANVAGTATVTVKSGTIGSNVHGGGTSAGNCIVGNTNVQVLGGTVTGSVYGGGYGTGAGVSTVTNNAAVTIRNATVGGVYGGGLYGTVGSASVTVGGGAKIGGVSKGVAINSADSDAGGAVTNGVANFKIDPALTGEDGSVQVVLPEGYTTGTIATNAVQADLAKIKLVGAGATGKEAYFDSNTIKVRTASATAPTVDSKDRYVIYANGAALIIAADGTGTTIYVDENQNGVLDLDRDKSLKSLNIDNVPSDGADLSLYTIYGGGNGSVITGGTKITMTGGEVDCLRGGGNGGNITGNAVITVSGGKVNSIYGGGNGGSVDSATITVSGGSVTNSVYGCGSSNGMVGSASVTVSGGEMSNVYGIGGGNITGAATVKITGGTVMYNVESGRGTVEQGFSVTVGGGAKIGSDGFGVVINGGTGMPVTNGVNSFNIDPNLSGADGNVIVLLPRGYAGGTIATGAVAGDLAKIKLTGQGATDRVAYFDSADNTIKVQTGALTDAQMLAMAKYAIEAALANLTVTNATTAQEILNAANLATLYGVTVQWDGADSFTKTEATQAAAGSITGTLKLSLNSESDTIALNKAIQKLPGAAFTITFHANGGSVSPTSAATGADGKLTHLPKPTRSDYRFDGWFTLANGGTRVTTATVFTQNSTIYAHWTDTGSGGSSGGGSDGSSGGDNSSTPPPIDTKEDQPGAPNTSQTEIPATEDGTGGTTVTVPSDAVDSAVIKAQEEAKKAGTEDNGVSVQIHVTSDSQTANIVTVNLPKVTQEKLIAHEVSDFTLIVDQPDIVIGLNLDSIKEIYRQANADVQISVARIINTAGLSAEAQTAIGNRPVFQLSASYRGGRITSFGDGSISIDFPYVLQSDELAGSLYAVYVDDSGKVNYLMNSSYDSREKVLRFTTDHFSVYGIGYRTPAVTFDDIQNHWAKEDIEFLAARGILNSIGSNMFSPDEPMTRAIFVTALGRMVGINPNSYRTSTFSDVPGKADYAPYVEWAASKGIMVGTEDGKFGPDLMVTRQEMAAVMSRYAKAMGYTAPAVRVAVTFADNASIEGWAADAVRQMQRAGVLMGKDNNLFDPTGPATRAQASATLRRYLELVIDWQTTQGWTQNDSGSWMYYRDGKPVTGTQIIDGTTYHFDAQGILQKMEAILPETKKYLLYKVQKNDTLWDLAKKYNCTVAEIADLNGIENPNLIFVGQKIKIPQK